MKFVILFAALALINLATIAMPPVTLGWTIFSLCCAIYNGAMACIAWKS